MTGFALHPEAFIDLDGYRRPKLTSRPLRFKLVREYAIACAPDKKPLWVVPYFMDAATPA